MYSVTHNSDCCCYSQCSTNDCNDSTDDD